MPPKHTMKGGTFGGRLMPPKIGAPRQGEAMPLTDLQAKKAAPKEKPYRLTDGGGMYLEVTPSGGRYWRLKYRFAGKEKRLGLGVYPGVSLSEARDKREAARKLIAQGIDPSAERKQAKLAGQARAANTFESVGLEWHAKQGAKWSETYRHNVLTLLQRWLFADLGARPIADMNAPELLAALRRPEAKGAHETAHRLRRLAGEILRYAIATGRAERDIAADLKGALSPMTVRHMPAVTEAPQVAQLLRALDAYNGWGVVRCALRLAPLVFVRPGELRAARWEDIDLEAGLWSYTISKTKTAHIVPLSRQAVALLREIQPLTGQSPYVFPSPRGQRPMSENALRMALIALGYGETQTPHGFRALARTLLDEVLGFPPYIIEQQLGHAVRDQQGRAYNRTAHLPQRKAMMQAWADYLDKLKEGAEIIPLRGAAA